MPAAEVPFMRIDRSWDTTTEQDREAARLTASLAGLAVALGLVTACLFLTHHLAANGRIEDCLMAGRFNCDELVAATDAPDSRLTLFHAP